MFYKHRFYLNYILSLLHSGALNLNCKLLGHYSKSRTKFMEKMFLKFRLFGKLLRMVHFYNIIKIPTTITTGSILLNVNLQILYSNMNKVK